MRTLYRKFAVGISASLFGFFIGNSAAAVDGARLHEETSQPGATLEDTDLIFDEPDIEGNDSTWEEQVSAKSFWDSYFKDPARISLSQEFSYKVEEPEELIYNRASLRFEYSKLFFDRVYAMVDTKTIAFLDDDHRHEAGDNRETLTSQAYLQTNINDTSIKLGVQTLAWGESELAVVTDEVSPRNNQELFNFNLEELRLGQSMIKVDQYSRFGRWNAFYIPDPKFNKYPGEGTAYYFDPFNGAMEILPARHDGRDYEYGLGWKKTFGSSDVTLMAADLIDNDYALRLTAPGVLSREELRYSLLGATVVKVASKFLFRGELGIKLPQAYNTADFDLIEKDAVDISLGVDYSASATLTLSFEAVDQHILDWEEQILTRRDRYTLFFGVRKLMMHDNLSINWRNIYNGPDKSFLSMLLTSYDWNNGFGVEANITVPSSDDKRADLWPYHDQKQVAVKLLYQF